MQREPFHAPRASLTGCALALLAACGGGGDGTGPPPGGDDPGQPAAAAAERAATAAAEFESQVAGGNPDPVGALVASLQADPDVEQVERFDAGGAVVASMKDGVPFSVMVAQQNRAEWTGSSPSGSSLLPLGGGSSASSFRHPATRVPITCDVTNYPQSKKACVMRAKELEFELFISDDVEPPLRRAGFEIVSPPWPTTLQQLVELQRLLPTCGVLYILAHGIVEKNFIDEKYGNHLVTDVKLPEELSARLEFMADLSSTFGETGFGRFFGVTGGDILGDVQAYLTLSPDFFASVEYPNTFVFINACGSDADLPTPSGLQLRNAFRQGRGAGAFLGWKSPVSNLLAYPAATEIFEALGPEATVEVIDGLTVEADPPNPGPGEPYTPIATVSPPQAGIEVGLTVRGSDGYEQDETGITGVNGDVFFSQVPGGQDQVTDVITASVGGADNSATAVNAILNSPTLQQRYLLPWFAGGVSVNNLTYDLSSDDFNLVCNNQKLVAVETVVKFGSLRARPNAAGQDLLTPGVRASRR